MSQITRCPSCATSFKVVADQLRISEGWVRCGQCKEVFDASAHLLPVAPAALLPDVSLTDVRPPPAPAARKSDAERAWGGGAAPPSSPALGRGAQAAPMAAHAVHPTKHADAGGHHAGTSLPTAVAPLAPAMPVLDIPAPTVPAFLAAGATASGADALSLAPTAPFSWRSVPTPWVAEAVDSSLHSSSPSLSGPTVDVQTMEEVLARPVLDAAAGAAAEEVALPTIAADADVAGAADVARGGYELPAADPHDSMGVDDLMTSGEVGVEGSLAGVSEALVGATGHALAAAPALEHPEEALSSGLPSADHHDAPPVVPATPGAVPESLPSVDFVQRPVVDEIPAALELVADDSPAAVLQARVRQPGPRQAEGDEQGEDAGDEAGPEVSFVVAARRKAFWRKPVVRAVLVLVLLVLVVGLLLQVAVQERDRIAATDPRARPWLLKLCEPLQCEVAPQRQIADVVIDSSSFNKARGDSYQLALTMKSKADIPLAMPAVELTLTDAQDQPVLRRVLLPNDMAAPAELPARGEWSTSVSVIVTTGGARVAGYRLLAFYP
ncbi:hypothetical protein CBY09_20815 [Acidovorax kalamii]|uniref:Zinc finger/thioredoxin putative domain-containing protein n=2 Tax=Acidovorax kalamii TaxID=2004485 RepID=A0A235EJ35_9BURK|nr:hypothetical protein CBY09_20815 [Acidovorax kalamii]